MFDPCRVFVCAAVSSLSSLISYLAEGTKPRNRGISVGKRYLYLPGAPISGLRQVRDTAVSRGLAGVGVGVGRAVLKLPCTKFGGQLSCWPPMGDPCRVFRVCGCFVTVLSYTRNS